jgi:hypothetical protein
MTNAKNYGLKIFATVVTLMVAAAVGVGISVAGSPAEQRALALDQQRADSLSQISGAIEAYYAATFELPPTLDALANDPRTQYAITSLKDPATGATFEYRAIDALSYELCGTFAFPSDNSQNGPASAPMMPVPASGSAMTWYVHAAGRVCQTENVAMHAPFQYCGAGFGAPACGNGQACVRLPGKNGAICVPTDKECIAAGCGGACSLDESVPPQVTCDHP